MREGEPAERFWLIRRGMVALELYVPGREPLVIETLEPSDVVGWSWLFAPYRWAGRASAEGLPPDRVRWRLPAWKMRVRP